MNDIFSSYTWWSLNFFLLLHNQGLKDSTRKNKFSSFTIRETKISSSAYSGNTINFDRRLISFVLHAQDSEGTQSNSWIKTHISLTEVEEEIFFFFCMLRMEGELNYTREIYILLLLQSQSGRRVSLENLCLPWY